MSLPPSEIPQGAIRFNTDSQRLEFYAQGDWWVMSTDTPNLGRSVEPTPGARAVYSQGSSTTLRFINFSSMGDGVSFGSLATSSYEGAALSSSTRGVWRCGYNGSTYTDTINYITLASTGTATAWGAAGTYSSNPTIGLSNQTRGIFAGKIQTPGTGYDNNMEYITIASEGVAAQDYGDMTFSGSYAAGCASPTRGIYTGNRGPGGTNPSVIDFCTIATLGTAQKFGDLTTSGQFPDVASNPIRGVIMGSISPSYTNRIEYVTISTTGNGSDFGDLTTARRRACGGAASSTRAVSLGGVNPSNPSTNTDCIEIQTFGNAIDFGDCGTDAASGSAVSNAHGGL